MKVMTFNVWNYTSPWEKRRAILARLIAENQPTAVALQETRHDFRFYRGKGQGEQLAELVGYHATVAVGQVYFPYPRVDESLTILTRNPPVSTSIRELSKVPRERADENQRVCICAQVREDGRDMYIFNSHFSLSESARLQNAIDVAQFVRTTAGDAPAVLMGDLNAEPDTRSIQYLVGGYVHEGHTGDFLDCWVQAQSVGPGFTYASFEPVRRIDYVLGRSLPPGRMSASIIGGEAADGVYASDHLGIVVKFVPAA